MQLPILLHLLSGSFRGKGYCNNPLLPTLAVSHYTPEANVTHKLKQIYLSNYAQTFSTMLKKKSIIQNKQFSQILMQQMSL